MHIIQDLFDSSKKLNRSIESVVTFGATTEQDLSSEIREYVVTEKLHANYERVLEDLQTAFNDSSKEVGIWVSGFYGSGKSSFAKYLGLSFDKSLLLDGVTFGDKLMSRIQDTTLAAMHRTIIAKHNPLVVMIDLSTQSVAGKIASVSDIVYIETLKQLGITKSTDQKVMEFVNLLHSEGKYEEFCQLVESEKGKTWSNIESNNLAASLTAAEFAPRVLPAYFPDRASFHNVKLSSSINEKERFRQLYKVVKEKTGKDKIIFVLDEVGQYVASNIELILNVQGMMQIFKDEFRGNVWVIATAQQTLTEDNRQAQLNSNELFRLNDRFPIKVDIEANDIKEIITKRLLGKSEEGEAFLKDLFVKNEGIFKNSIHLSLQERSIYNQVLTPENFANLYPFLPVHIDILLSLLQKLASRTGGVGLRSVIRLIRDILVDNNLAGETIGQLAGPEHFYDVLHSDMEKNAAKEIVLAADKAIQVFSGNALAVRVCKTIAVMQLLDDFNLSFDNICALLSSNVDSSCDKLKIRDVIDQISQAEGLTLQEVDGKYQFMTNAILEIRDERNRIIPRDSEKAEVLQNILTDLMTPAPSVNVYGSKTINAGVELFERNRPYNIYQGSGIKINVRFVDGANFDDVHRELCTESMKPENNKIVYWLCTLGKDKEAILQEIVRSQNIKNRHPNETNKEIAAYLRAQSDFADEQRNQLSKLLREAQGNSEMIFRGNPKQVNAESYKNDVLKVVAEKVYEKYPLASANMKSDCVTKLAAFGDLKTIPQSLNVSNIIKTADGTIDIANPTLTEIKEFIASRNEVSGQEIQAHFERDPYGWSKDTIRYLVALMLKASMVQIRVGGKNLTVFAESATEAMASNNSFGKVSVSLIVDGALTPKELLAAVKNLTALFNSNNIAPIKDQIAKEALVKIKEWLPEFNRLQNDFAQLKLEGLNTIKQAVTYANRIIDTDGGEAASLLGKDVICYNAFKFIVEFKKADEQSSILDNLKYLSKMFTEIGNLQQILLMPDFAKQMDEAQQIYGAIILKNNISAAASEIMDLKNQVDSYLKQACIEYQTRCNSQLDGSRNSIKSMPEYVILPDSQKKQVDSLLDELCIEFNEYSSKELGEKANVFAAYYLPTATIDSVKKEVIRLAQQQTETQDATEQPKAANEKTAGYSGHTIRARRKISSKQELQVLITTLTQCLKSVSEEHPVELTLND